MGLLIALAFLVVPVVELYVIVQVGQEIGVLETIGLMLLVSAVGAWLVKREGVRAWQAFQRALGTGRVPAREVLDGALILFAGALLLTPGFVSDAFGVFLLLPPTRALVRRAGTGWVARRFVVVGGPPPGEPPAPGPGPGSARGGPRPGSGRVVEGETVRRDGPPAE